MEQLISDIEAYCAARGLAPQKFLRDAINATWGLWDKWKAGEASPRLDTADKLYAIMGDAAHTPSPVSAPPADQGRDAAALSKRAGGAA